MLTGLEEMPCQPLRQLPAIGPLPEGHDVPADLGVETGSHSRAELNALGSLPSPFGQLNLPASRPMPALQAPQTPHAEQGRHEATAAVPLHVAEPVGMTDPAPACLAAVQMAQFNLHHWVSPACTLPALPPAEAAALLFHGWSNPESMLTPVVQLPESSTLLA